MYGLRIVLADPDAVFRQHMREQLLKSGYMVVAETGDGRNALQLIFNIQPDLAIVNLQLPGKDGLDITKTITEHRVAPVLLITEPDKQDEIQEALQDWPFSYILKPVDDINLQPAIEVCVASFKRMCQLEQENQRLAKTIETRRVMEKAKGLLVEYKGMTEQQAYKHIQKVSMDKCLPLKNVAQQIIMIFERQKSRKGRDGA